MERDYSQSGLVPIGTGRDGIGKIWYFQLFLDQTLVYSRSYLLTTMQSFPCPTTTPAPTIKTTTSYKKPTTTFRSITDCVCTLSCNGQAVTEPSRMNECVIMCFGDHAGCNKEMDNHSDSGLPRGTYVFHKFLPGKLFIDGASRQFYSMSLPFSDKHFRIVIFLQLDL